MPSSISAYSVPASDAEGDTIAIGNIETVLVEHADASREFLMANSWYLSPHHVQSTYTTIGYETYTKRFCVLYSGNLCPRGLTALFETDPATGAVRADLLSVSSLQLLRTDFSARRLDNPPQGWHVAHRGTYAVTWVRDRVLPRAGGVTWTSDGVRVTERSRDTRSVTFTVDAVPDGGGRVVLSRLEWPGYTVSGADLADPTDGYLTTVSLTPASVGTEVTVSFRPPGWTLELATLATATLLGLGWVLLAAVRRRPTRPKPEEAVGEGPDAGSPGETTVGDATSAADGTATGSESTEATTQPSESSAPAKL
jgi:hypothetical protein